VTDTAVSLVQAYLIANGYFTITEYQVVEAVGNQEYRTATDLDVLAVRFPRAGRYIPGLDGGERFSEPDPALRTTDDRIDFLIGEVKEGYAQLNRAARQPEVLRAALTRFGAVAADHADDLVGDLVANGVALVPEGPRVRLAAFGTRTGDPAKRPYLVVGLGHMGRFLRRLAAEHYEAIKGVGFKDPVLGMISLIEKSGRAG
jgi:hypothetical protein